jgi:hypothetical protein
VGNGEINNGMKVEASGDAMGGYPSDGFREGDEATGNCVTRIGQYRGCDVSWVNKENQVLLVGGVQN